MVKGLDVFAKAFENFSNCYIVIGGTHILTNQLGYVFANEHQSFDHRKFIEV